MKNLEGNYSELTLAYIRTGSDANVILEQFKITQPPVPTSLVTMIFRDASIAVKHFSDEALGFSVPQDGHWNVLIDDQLSLGAKRFTLFHELWHMVNSEVGFNKETDEGKLREKKADYFAACILMPARWFRRYWELSHDIDKMAQIFLVSRKAVEIRLKGLNHYIATP